VISLSAGVAPNHGCRLLKLIRPQMNASPFIRPLQENRALLQLEWIRRLMLVDSLASPAGFPAGTSAGSTRQPVRQRRYDWTRRCWCRVSAIVNRPVILLATSPPATWTRKTQKPSFVVCQAVDRGKNRLAHRGTPRSATGFFMKLRGSKALR